ncbi:MAG: GHKL domain-containing protein, partial [Pseudomonadales bacterium]|nr:GHKL domain-containing protein [Pseudomonadales bacterium]
LTDKLSAFQQPSWDIAIVNNKGWILSPQIQNNSNNEKNGNTLNNEIIKSSPTLWESALSRFYRYIMEGVIEGKNSSTTLPVWPYKSTQLSQSKQEIPLETLTRYQNQWYRVSHSQRSILSVINPIHHNDSQEIIGYVILTQSSNALLSLTNNALLRIINLSLTTAALSALVLLGFASILSYRIRSLRNQAEKAVSYDGKVQPFSASKSKDEIGDLSRSYAVLLQRIQDYNHYLETLSGKLAHELRTPLTISKSSIEMLKMVDSNDTEKHQRYLLRAEEGLERLRLILNAMSEASRVEQVIQHSDIQPVDIKNLMHEMCLAYQDTYPDFTFTFNSQQGAPAPEITLHCAPELIAQMLDKLIDNATGFAPKHSEISLSLTATEKSLRLTVDNTGPLLPDNMQQQLFDSMVSIRKEKTDTPHLGLGLYIVKLIAQHHHGQLSACNNVEESGVSFCVELPTR